MELYLCRHGETAWTLSGQHTGRSDLSLTEEGARQALRLRKRLKGIQFEQIFTSPKRRAMETCEGLSAVVEPLAVECDYGEYEGLTTEEIHEREPQWDLFTSGAPGGETLQQMGARADQLLEKLRRYEGRVALFSHGHFLRVLTVRFLGLPPELGKLLFLSVASLSILGHDRGSPVITLWNEETASKGVGDRRRLKG